MASRRICSRLGPRSGLSTVLPVIFPPGRARLATRPARTGSPTPIITMGTVAVACLAAGGGKQEPHKPVSPKEFLPSAQGGGGAGAPFVGPPRWAGGPPAG